MKREELIKKFCEIVIHVGLSEDTEPTIEGIVKELRRTNCDGCKSFAGELESLSFAADSLTPAVKESLTVELMTVEEAQRCPVCGGNGLVPNGFYNTVTGIGSTTSIAPEKCLSCNGTGIVFPYASKPTVAERVITDIVKGVEKLTGEKVESVSGHFRVAEREVPEDIITELEKENPYPETVFLPMSESEITEVAEYLKKGGYSIDSLAGNTMRRSWNLCVGRLRELIKGGK